MGRLCEGTHEISGIHALLFLRGWVVGGFMGWVGVMVVLWWSGWCASEGCGGMLGGWWGGWCAGEGWEWWWGGGVLGGWCASEVWGWWGGGVVGVVGVDGVKIKSDTPMMPPIRHPHDAPN